MGWLKSMCESESSQTKNEWQRGEGRTSIHGKVDVKIGDRVFLGNIRDITPTSLGITCRDNLPICEVLVRPAFTKDWLLMRIVHSTQTVGGYKIGMTTAKREPI